MSSSSSTSARPSSSSSSLRTFASSSRTLKTGSPIIPTRADSLNSPPPSPLIPPPPSPTTSTTTSFQTTNLNLPTSDKDLVGVNTVYSLGQAGERLEREERLKKKGNWDEERELEEVLQEIGAGFDDGEFRLGGPLAAPLSRTGSKKDKLLIVLGLPLPAPSQPSTPSSLPTPTATTPSSPLPPLPSSASLQRRPSSPLRSTTKLPTPPFNRRPSLPPSGPPGSSNAKGPLSPTSLEKPTNGFSHSRRTSLNLGFGIAIHLGGNSTASLSSPTGSSSPNNPLPTSPRVTFHNNTSSHPPSSSSSSNPSLGTRSSTGNGNGTTSVQSSLATSMSSFSFGASSSSSSSSQSKPRRGLVGSASSSSLREQDPLSVPSAPATKVGKSGSKRDLAGFLGRRRGEGEGHAIGRSVSSSGGVDGHGHRDKSPSMFPLQSLLKQTFTSSSSSSSSSASTPSLQPQPQQVSNAPTPLRALSPSSEPSSLLGLPSPSASPAPRPPPPPRTPTPTQQAPAPAPPSTHLLASALRIERLLSPNPSALALAAARPTHELHLADPPSSPTFPAPSSSSTAPYSTIFHHPTFSPYHSSPQPTTSTSTPSTLTDSKYISNWILTGVGRPAEELSRRVRDERRRRPFWNGPSPPLPQDQPQRHLTPPSRSSSTSTAGGRDGEEESSGEESGTLATPSTSSPSFDQVQQQGQENGQGQVGMGGRELRVWEEKQGGLKGRKVGVEEEEEREGEREREKAERELMVRLGGGGGGAERGSSKVRINLVPASPGGKVGGGNRF